MAFLGIVFANAGINKDDAPVEEIEPEVWDRTINANLPGTFLTVEYTEPHLTKRGARMILIASSINGTRVFSDFGARIRSHVVQHRFNPAQLRTNGFAMSFIRQRLDRFEFSPTGQLK